MTPTTTLLSHHPRLLLLLLTITITTTTTLAQTSIPSQQPSYNSPSCTDESPTWTDGSTNANTCKWYSMNNRCSQYGDDTDYANPITNTTANAACCVCGGGIPANLAETPSSSPSTSLPPTVLCVDAPGWEDDVGDTCVYYNTNQENGACTMYGDCCANMGHTANTACCACGGGFYRSASDGLVHIPSFVPSVGPSSVPSVSTPPSVSHAPSNMASVHPTVEPSLFPSDGMVSLPVLLSDIITDGPTNVLQAVDAGGDASSSSSSSSFSCLLVQSWRTRGVVVIMSSVLLCVLCVGGV